MNPLKLVVLTLSALAVAAPALAADPYPSKPVRIVVNSTPGGLTDVIARLVSGRMAKEAGQPVVVENRPGSVVGIDAVAKAAPDGYTVALSANSISTLPSLVSNLPFHPQTSLAPVALVSSAPMVLITGGKSSYPTVRDYVADARSRPGQISIASGGNGTLGHLLAEQLQASAGIRLIHVPYKGGAPAVADVMAGHAAVFFDTIATTAPLARDGKVRALAIVGDKRSPVLPQVPTLSEAGVEGVHGVSWFGMFAPAGTPPEVIAKINAWLNEALQAPDVRERFGALGITPEGGTPRVMAELLDSEIPRWAKLVRERNIKAD